MPNSKSTNYKASKTLAKISKEVLSQDDLASEIIIRRDRTYYIFNTYTLSELNHSWVVSGDSLLLPILFNTAKVALAWCILQKVGCIQIADHMRWLDSRVAAKQADIDILTYLLESSVELETRTMLLARLMEDINDRQQYKKQLAKYVNSAKSIKLHIHRN